MMFPIFALLCFARASLAAVAIIDGMEVDCFINCACCKGGKAQCVKHATYGEYYCNEGCVDTITGNKCRNNCKGNCLTCEHNKGSPCYTCKNSFHDLNSNCTKSCSVGCDGGSCNIDGTCSPCKADFEGLKCKSCILGKYGTDCSKDCKYKNCQCSNGSDCISCKTGYYDRSTFCNNACSPGCQGACNDDGSCICRQGFIGSSCNGCVPGFYGADNCDTKCSSNCETCQQESGICDSCTNITAYGPYCNDSCNPSCIESKCEQINGHCSIGCNLDFVGNMCETKCSEHCLRNVTETSCNTDGHCYYGCVDGFEGADCKVQMGAVQGDPPIGAVLGGVSGSVVIIGVIVAIIFFRRRTLHRKFGDNTTEERAKESNERTNYNEGQITRESTKPNQTDASENEINLEVDDQTYYNELGSSTIISKIPIGQLVQHVDGKSHEAFSAEFEKLSRGLVKPYVESQKRENMSKNRYKGIYPYDDSRVKVTGGGGLNYINASYIDGYEKPKEYIATLGPMSEQLGDFSLFWNMIWQQKVEKIVMVTNLIEHGSTKCEQYWPTPGTTQKFGNIKVESRSEDEYAEFTRRTFTVTMGGKERTLHHLHFTCWPDKAVPDDVTAMIEFRQRVLNTQSTMNGPTVVHCSAGVGRTGTYIALDILTKEGEAERAIDIAGCVNNMRQNRPNMVQTLEQYQFLHTATVYSLTFDCKQIKGENFNQYMNNHSLQELNSQFNRLMHTVKQRFKDETEAVERNKQQLNKNRANADIPGDENRPRLHMNLTQGATDYINAVYIHSFRIKKRYLVAQTPLPETVIDFLTLVVQERCSCIVSFEAGLDEQKNTGKYYPAANQHVLKTGTFQVSCSREEKKSFYAERTMTIQHKRAGTTTDQSIPHLQFTDWDKVKNIPRSTTNFLSFLNVIESVTKNQDGGPILVHCVDGAGKSGLFCVVSLLLHKMAVEHEVSVLNTVRKVKPTRRLAIPNQEQFVYCHECVSEYLSSFDVYANFNE